MSAILFAGPSLADARDVVLPPHFMLRPPARQGDVFHAFEARPSAIGLIDGYFEGVPSVWHKEILWAMSRGIAFYGSASMGALRAAELHAYGMVGVGEIFSAYRDGTLEGDDEVALLHGPEETGFIPLTEPLVNVRATCRAAVTQNVIDGVEAESVIAGARSVFYKDRTWREITRHAVAAGFSADRISDFTAWLPRGRIDQKQLDAHQMIERMREDIKDLVPVQSEFEPTFLWERAVAGWTRAEARTARRAENLDDAVLNEIRLVPKRYRLLKARARARMQMLREAGDDAPPLTHSERANARKRHRMAHGLLRSVDLDRWLGVQHLDRSEYDRLIEETAVADNVASSEDAELHHAMIVLLKLDGEFGAAASKAAAKAAAPTAGEGKAQARSRLPPVLLEWFFRTRLEQEVPEDLDSFVGGLGLSREAFYGLLAEEYLYSRDEGTDQPS